MSDPTVEVNYLQKIVATGSQITWAGELYDCNSCGYTACCGTVDNISNPNRAQCLKCACQAKGTTKCGLNDFCAAFVSQSCSGNNTNAPIYGAEVTATMTCSDALDFVQDTSNKVLNATTINTVCDPVKRLACCKGQGTQAACGTFWGNNNTTGDCDAIMQEYCDNPVHVDEQVCNCLNSSLPMPQCVDTTCVNTTAYKNKFMVSNRCEANIQVCQQFVNFDPNSANVITNSPIIQQCLQINSQSSAPPTGLNKRKLITVLLIAGGVVLGLVLLGVLFIPSKSRKAKLSQ